MNRVACTAGFREWGLGFLLLSLIFFAGCASANRKTTLPIVLVNQASNGAEVRIVPGQEIQLQLIVNIQDDIRWMMVGELDEAVLKPMGQRLFQARDAQDRPLTRPLEELRFRGVGNGEVVVDLAYIPVGGTLADSTNRFFLKVIVDEFRARPSVGR